MHITTVGVGKKMSTVGVARLYKGRKEIGLCIDSPNSIACAMRFSGATRAVDTFGGKVKISKERLDAGGWIALELSGYQAR